MYTFNQKISALAKITLLVVIVSSTANCKAQQKARNQLHQILVFPDGL